jgi:acyl-CoA thioester hydrolase
MRGEEFIGRVSDGIGALLGDIRQIVAQAAEGQHSRVGGAVLEYRLCYFDWPGIGEQVEVRSGLTAIGDKVQHMGHWLINSDTLTPLGFSEAVAVTFDLDTRKTIPISDEARQALNPRLISGHRFGL